jgi:hypothetical protein
MLASIRDPAGSGRFQKALGHQCHDHLKGLSCCVNRLRLVQMQESKVNPLACPAWQWM